MKNPRMRLPVLLLFVPLVVASGRKLSFAPCHFQFVRASVLEYCWGCLFISNSYQSTLEVHEYLKFVCYLIIFERACIISFTEPYFFSTSIDPSHCITSSSTSWPQPNHPRLARLPHSPSRSSTHLCGMIQAKRGDPSISRLILVRSQS